MEERLNKDLFRHLKYDSKLKSYPTCPPVGNGNLSVQQGTAITSLDTLALYTCRGSCHIITAISWSFGVRVLGNILPA